MSRRFARRFSGLGEVYDPTAVDRDAVAAADAAELKANEDRAREGIRERAAQARSAALAISKTVPIAAPFMAVFALAVTAGLAIAEGIISAVNLIGYGDQNSEADYARMVSAANAVMSIGLPTFGFDSELTFYRKQAEVLEKHAAAFRSDPKVLAAGKLFYKHMDAADPVLHQMYFDQTKSSFGGWFRPFVLDDANLRQWATGGPAAGIARVLHLEYHAPEDNIRAVATDAYARHWQARAAAFDIYGNPNLFGLSLECFAAAWEAAEIYAKANRVEVLTIAPLSVQTFALSFVSPTLLTSGSLNDSGEAAAEAYAPAPVPTRAPAPASSSPGSVSPAAVVVGGGVLAGVAWFAFSKAGKAALAGILKGIL